jgi:hypothetical protein
MLRKSQINGVYGVQVAFPHSEPVMELQQRQMALSEYGAGLIDPMTYYEAAGYENGTEIKNRLLQESIRQLPSVREKIERTVAEEMGLVDEENQEQAGQEIQQRQMAQQPDIMGGQTAPDLNTPLTPDTFTPNRINLAQ